MFSLTQPLPSFTLLSACSGQSTDSCELAVAATAGQAEPWEVCLDGSHMMILHRQIPAPTLGSVSAEKSLLLGAPAPPHSAGQLQPTGRGYATTFFPMSAWRTVAFSEVSAWETQLFLVL